MNKIAGFFLFSGYLLFYKTPNVSNISPCAITKTQKITFYYVEKSEGMLRSSQIMIKFAAICNVEFAK